ncbi:flagellar assembly protein FliH [bacterium]|nr:flagellar assembly protein FliH [bacterium]
MTSIRLVKSNTQQTLDGYDVFNEHEAGARHRQIIEQAKLEAEKIVQQAHDQAAFIEREAARQAHEVGLNQGLQSAAGRIEELADARAQTLADAKLTTALPAIHAAAVQIRQKQDELVSSTMDSSVEICLALAEQLLHRVIEFRPQSIREFIAEPLRMAGGCNRIELRLHPDDFVAIGNRPEDFVGDLAGCRDVRIVKDATVARGGCVITTNQGEIDAQIETQLKRIADELIADGQWS